MHVDKKSANGVSRTWRAVGVMVAVIAASLGGLAAPAQAVPQTAVMVADINPGSASSNLFEFADLNGTVLFGADDGTHGTELWKTDGTAAGTSLLKDINPGSASGIPSLFTNINGTTYFTADDGVSGRELWKTDGTAGGTVQVADINPGAGSSIASFDRGYLAAVGNALFFGANDGTHGVELWKTDGTAAGTVMVKDIAAGSSSSIGSHPYLFDFNGTLLFSASDGTTGAEPWKTDGTAGGTVQVADINPGGGNSNWQYQVILNGAVFFKADDGTHGQELWKTDGTTAGTVMVLDYLPDIPGYGLKPQFLAAFNGAVYFVGSGGNGNAGQPGIGNELWKSDGTATGTVLVKDIYPGANDAFSVSDDPVLAVANGALLFSATDGTTSGAGGRELWKTDGTTAGTVRVKDINPGTGSSMFGQFQGVIANSTLYFAASDGTVGSAKGLEVWQSDGTAAGTVRTADIRPGTASSSPQWFANVGGTVYFTADDGTHGRELWRLNSAPVAADDSYTTNEDAALSVGAPGVLANDTDAEGNPRTAGSPSTPAHGSVTLNPDGSFTYTPLANYNGPDSFTYVTSDGFSSSNVATVNIMVSPVNDPPVAADDAYSTNQDTPLSVALPGVLANDTDTDADALTAGSASAPAHGAVSVAADGSFTYTPAASYAGPDSFTYTASDGNGGAATATVNITVVATGPTRLAVSDVTVTEGSSGGTTPVNFVITRTGVNSAGSTVNVKTTNGTATTAGNDYTAIPLSTVAFAPGETSQTVTVNVTADTFYEKNETFNLVLSGTQGATIADGAGVATILNDDSAPTLSVNDVTVPEGDSGTTPATFTVTRAGNTTGAVTVKVKTTNGTAKTADNDYVAVPSTTLSFADGEITKTVDVNVNGDPFFEKNETFNLVLSSPVGALISDATGVGTIANDDASPLLSVDDVSHPEGNTGTTTDYTFTVTRAGNTRGAVTVKAKTSNGTATTVSGDYVAYPTTVVTFADGQTTATVTVHVNGDGLHENDETFSLVLSYPVGATIADATGKATIVNDD